MVNKVGLRRHRGGQYDNLFVIVMYYVTVRIAEQMLDIVST